MRSFPTDPAFTRKKSDKINDRISDGNRDFLPKTDIHGKCEAHCQTVDAEPSPLTNPIKNRNQSI